MLMNESEYFCNSDAYGNTFEKVDVSQIIAKVKERKRIKNCVGVGSSLASTVDPGSTLTMGNLCIEVAFYPSVCVSFWK